jgi:hypothetical protein
MATLRDSIKIARVVAKHGFEPSGDDERFKVLCMHVLTSQNHFLETGNGKRPRSAELLEMALRQIS